MNTESMNDLHPLQHRLAARRLTFFSVILWAIGAVAAFLPWEYHYEAGLTLMALSFAIHFGGLYYLSCDNESCRSE
jgi:hypothetical protein